MLFTRNLHKTDAACFLSAVRGQEDTRMNGHFFGAAGVRAFSITLSGLSIKMMMLIHPDMSLLSTLRRHASLFIILMVSGK